MAALYPPDHPAPAAAIARLTGAARAATEDGPLTLSVTPDALLLDGRAPLRPDPAIRDLAALLHHHAIGLLVVHSDSDPATWRAFVALLALPPDQLRSQGGIAHAWETSGTAQLELRQLDYSELVRDTAGTREATWDCLIAQMLEDDLLDLDEAALTALADLARDPARLAALARQVEAASTAGPGAKGHAVTLVRLLTRVAEFVRASRPDTLDSFFGGIAGAICQLSEEFVTALVAARDETPADPHHGHLVDEIIDHLQPPMLADFVANAVVAHRGATARLVALLCQLLPDVEMRRPVVALARERLADMPLDSALDSAGLDHILTALLDGQAEAPGIPDAYDRELDASSAPATSVEQVTDDPPERIAAWIRTLDDAALRALDTHLLLDLMALEDDPDRWREAATTVLRSIEEAVLVGDLPAARRLIEALKAQQPTPADPYRVSWVIAALDPFVTGRLVDHLRPHLQTIAGAEFDEARRLCLSAGSSLVAPLAEAIGAEAHPRVRQRLIALLLAFGAEGRRTVASLLHSDTPAVRRTAVGLLRQFGGRDAVDTLAALLHDADKSVRTEAVRALMTLGSDEGFRLLERTLTSGPDQAREAMLSELSAVRDRRAVPLLAHILKQTAGTVPEHVQLTAAARLGSLGGHEAVVALGDALRSGGWWAPGRSARLREAAAQALARLGTPDARAVLEEAALRGPRRSRRVAREALAR